MIEKTSMMKAMQEQFERRLKHLKDIDFKFKLAFGKLDLMAKQKKG